MYIYTKRIDHVNLCIVMHNFGRCRVLLYKGKRADFTDFKKAKAKVWQLEQTLGKGAEWTGWMAKSELEARINARLDRALEACFENKEQSSLVKSVELGAQE
jgi:hypothetical protein